MHPQNCSPFQARKRLYFLKILMFAIVSKRKKYLSNSLKKSIFFFLSFRVEVGVFVLISLCI